MIFLKTFNGLGQNKLFSPRVYRSSRILTKVKGKEKETWSMLGRTLPDFEGVPAIPPQQTQGLHQRGVFDPEIDRENKELQDQVSSSSPQVSSSSPSYPTLYDRDQVKQTSEGTHIPPISLHSSSSSGWVPPTENSSDINYAKVPLREKKLHLVVDDFGNIQKVYKPTGPIVRKPEFAGIPPETVADAYIDEAIARNHPIIIEESTVQSDTLASDQTQNYKKLLGTLTSTNKKIKDIYSYEKREPHPVAMLIKEKTLSLRDTAQLQVGTQVKTHHILDETEFKLNLFFPLNPIYSKHITLERYNFVVNGPLTDQFHQPFFGLGGWRSPFENIVAKCNELQNQLYLPDATEKIDNASENKGPSGSADV